MNRYSVILALLLPAILSGCAAVGQNAKVNEVNVPANRGDAGSPNNSKLSTNGMFNTNNILFFGDNAVNKAPDILKEINQKWDVKDPSVIIDPKESDSAKKN